MATEMTPYDRRAWTEIEEWRRRRLESQARRLLPERLRRRMSEAGQSARARFESIPGATEFEAIFVKALGGLLDVGSRAAMATVGHEAIVEAYRKRGHEVADIDDIGKLELCEMDKVRPNLGLAYTAAATVEGAAAGFAVSGGEIVAAGGSVFGAGVGGAPGIGTVVGVMAADAAVVLVAANRAVAHIAAYYGYDVDHPDERLFALGVLSVGTAAEAGKATAYIELNKLVQALARRATWDQLRQNAVTRVVEKVFTRLGYRITQRKLGQAVPVFGTVIGAGMNAHLLSSVTHDANHIYRERFLRDHYGLAHEPLATPPMNETDVVDVAELLHEEIAKEDGRPTDGGDGERS